jgi:hypothetical protein
VSHAIRVSEIGWKADRLLAGCTPAPSIVAALSQSVYLDIAGEIVWLGPAGSTLHPRAILVDSVPSRMDGRVPGPFDLSRARRWRPAPLGPLVGAPSATEAVRALVVSMASTRAEGFGSLLRGEAPVFPLDRAADDVQALFEACAGDDAPRAGAAAERLLGLGPGLTPAGDDLVGAAFFARHLLAAGRGDAERWRATADALRARARERTHRISATLLGDLLAGDAYAPLHDLAAALLAVAPPGAAVEAAERLVRIGHSSGWDMLTGFLGGLGPLPGGTK